MAQLKTLNSKYDQENLLASIEEWKQECPEDCLFFAPVKEDATTNGAKEDATTDGPSNVQSSGSLFVYQSKWQRHLLNRYGGELCLLDAKYRTTKYAVPLWRQTQIML